MADAAQPITGRPAVLALVKREGPIAADALAGRLKLTSTAVRQHLQALAEEGLVAEAEARRRRAAAGRRGSGASPRRPTRASPTPTPASPPT